MHMKSREKCNWIRRKVSYRVGSSSVRGLTHFYPKTHGDWWSVCVLMVLYCDTSPFYDPERIDGDANRYVVSMLRWRG